MFVKPLDGLRLLTFVTPINIGVVQETTENEYDQYSSTNKSPHGHWIVRQGVLYVANYLLYVGQAHSSVTIVINFR